MNGWMSEWTDRQMVGWHPMHDVGVIWYPTLLQSSSRTLQVTETQGYTNVFYVGQQEAARLGDWG